MSPPLVLASRSPRRARLLEMLGLSFDVEPTGIEELRRAGEEPAAYAERLARDKAAAAAARRPDALVIGADTIVVLDGDVLEKPADEEEAVAMLLRLQGREHTVHSGVAVAGPGGRVESAAESVAVRFHAFEERTAREYAATGEPFDKAGSYGIQGFGAVLVASIRGDYFAVMGLPLSLLMRLFPPFGWRYDFGGLTRIG